MEVILVTVLIVGIAFLGIGLNIFFRKGGKFPETEVGTNRHMRELGIKCTRCEELRKYNEYKRKLKARINYSTLKLDTTSV